MSIADALRDIGHPIVYYPCLAQVFGSVKAAVFFGQVFYWQDKTENPLGVYKSSEEWREETGLSYEEQRTARKALKALSVLVESERRLEHRIYFKIDNDALQKAYDTWKKAAAKEKKENKLGLRKTAKALQIKASARSSRNGKSPFREVEKTHAAEQEKSSSPIEQSSGGDTVEVQSVNRGEITAQTTTTLEQPVVVVEKNAAKHRMALELAWQSIPQEQWQVLADVLEHRLRLGAPIRLPQAWLAKICKAIRDEPGSMSLDLTGAREIACERARRKANQEALAAPCAPCQVPVHQDLIKHPAPASEMEKISAALVVANQPKKKRRPPSGVGADT